MNAEIKAALTEYHATVKGAFEPVNAKLDKLDEKTGELGARLQAAETKIVTVESNSHGGYVPMDSATEENQPISALALDGQRYPVIVAKARMAARFQSVDGGGENWSVADYVRASMGLAVQNSTIVTGPALVPEYVSGQIIDAVRARSTIVAAGAATIPIDGPTTLARILRDPEVYQHDEGVEDIEESGPTFEPVRMDPKALVAAVPLTQEVVADSRNLNAALTASLGAAFAQKLDSLCLEKILMDGTIAGGDEDPSRWMGVLMAVRSAMALDQGIPPALINNAVDHIIRAGATDLSGGWVETPTLLANMAQLPTTKLPQGTAIMGDFARSFAIAVRQGLQMEVIRFGKHKSYTHILIAHARMDGYVLQPDLLYVCSGASGSSSSE